MNEKKTIWQRLTNVLSTGENPMGKDFSVENDKFGSQPAYTADLLTAKSKEELKLKKLELQQNKYIADQYQSISNDRYNQSVYYETTRYGSYLDFEAMEYSPEIAAALDIMGEESTTLHDNGKMLNIHSNSDRIKKTLENLFYNIIDINSNLPAWTRNTCKYGDNFVFIKSEPKQGVTKVTQMKNLEIKRLEGDGVTGDETIKFEWKQNNLVFNSWQIAHFRLIGDDKKLPYGTSVLEKARKIWKMMCLAEDAMMIYRLSRAPERRVFKIDVGNIDPDDVEAHVQKIASKFKRTTQVNQTNGQIDLRQNIMTQDEDYFIPIHNNNNGTVIDTLPGACLSLDTKIPLLDGRTLSLQDIISEWDNGNRNLWVYSCDSKTGKPAPGMISWAGITRKNTKVLKIILDNGKEIISTPDHKFIHRINGFVKAQDLFIGDSLMPFYSQTKKIKSNSNDYHQVWDIQNEKWVYTHRLVKDNLLNSGLIKEFIFNDNLDHNDKFTVHHKDFNRFNNNPSNLLLMNNKDHIVYHQAIIKETIWVNPKLNKLKISKGLKKYILGLSEDEKAKKYSKNILNPIVLKNNGKRLLKWNGKLDNLKSKGLKIAKSKSSLEYKKQMAIENKNRWSNGVYNNNSVREKIKYSELLFEIINKNFDEKLTYIDLLKILNNNSIFSEEFKSINLNISRNDFTGEFKEQHLYKLLKEKGYKNYREFKKCRKESNLLFNHKIINIEWLDDKIDTGTITVDGNELYNNYHTFALESGIYVKNSNLAEIGDIEFLQNKLFAAIRTPKAFLGFGEGVGDGKNLAMLDVRFARTINRIQQAMLQELNKIAIIHLYLLGFTEDLNNFSLVLANPSSQADMLKQELWSAKFDNYKKAVEDAGNGFGAFSMTRAKKDFLGMSDEEIVLDLLQQRLEKAEAIRNSPEVLQTKNINSGIFNTLDNKFTDKSIENQMPTGQTGSPDMGGSGGMGGGGGSPDFGNMGGGTDMGGGLDNLDPSMGGDDSEMGGDDSSEEIPGNLNENTFAIDQNQKLKEEIKKTLEKVDKLIND